MLRIGLIINPIAGFAIAETVCVMAGVVFG
jgi:predicted polyphosphate/ATP-dependent NAD kinase